MKNLVILFSFYILTFFVEHTLSKKEKKQKISDINVLLPICESLNCNRVYYSIHARGGCYEWSVDKQGYLDIEQIHSNEESYGCYHKVMISPQKRQFNLNEVIWLSAKDKKSNEEFKCKVGFGKINKLIINKKFDRINTHEIAEINVNAYDEKDNMFSSLEGYRFNWKITDNNLVEILKLSQEKREVGEKRLEEENKHHSDIILLKGINAGKVNIMTEILEEEYKKKNIRSDVKSLYVVEPYGIYPNDPIYILPSNIFNFNIELYESFGKSAPSHQHKFVSPMNRKFYEWEVENESCGTIKNFGVFESGSLICSTKVIAEDNRLDYFNSAWNQVNVVHPTAMDIQLMEITNEEASQLFANSFSEDVVISKFHLFEIKNSHRYERSNVWKLVENRKYLIKNVLMHELHQIRYSRNGIDFNLNVDDELKSHLNDILCFHGKEICLLTTKSVTADYIPLESSVEACFGIDKNYHIKKNVKIFPQLKIEKFGLKEFTLPFLGYYQPYEYHLFNLNETSTNPNDFIKSQELRLIVNGGTEKFLFNAENTEVIQISEESLYGKNIGRTTVKVTDAEIPSNFDEVYVEVKEVKDFTFLEERQEIELGNEFFVSTLGLKRDNIDNDISKFNLFRENVFTNCTNLMLNTSLSLKDKNILSRGRFEVDKKLSNYNAVSSFLKENAGLKKEIHKLLKVDKLQENDQLKTYLDYINYGLCDSKSFIANNEGLLKLSISSQIFAKKTSPAPNRIISTNISKVYVYSPMTLISPKIDDIFTKELLAKGNVVDPNKFKNFIISPESSLSIQFTGGIIPWIENKKDYSETIYLIDKTKNRTASAESIKDYVKASFQTYKKLIFRCLKENVDVEYTVTIANKMDKTLLRPGKSSFSFSIGCYHPKYLSIFILNINNKSQGAIKSQNSNSTREDQLNEVFNVPQRGGIEYFEKKNNLEVVRVYAFDDNKRILMNVTSIKGEWKQRDLIGTGKFFKLMNEKEYQNYIRSTTGIEKHSYDRVSAGYSEFLNLYILFENRVGKFDLIYTTKNKESNYATINLIDFPSLSPSNSTLYLSSNNSLEISVENGSGDFDISLNDNSIAVFSYSNRKIKLIPLKQGILYVYLKDNKLNNNFVAIATVYVSTIKQIQLIGGGLLMTNTTMNIGLKVYDNFDNVFHHSQLAKMDLMVGDYSHISKGIQLKFQDIQQKGGKSFEIKGLLSDVYTLYIIDPKSAKVSNSIRLEVFDKLQVFPPYLLMVPGSSYTLSIRGGPTNEEHIIKRYEILDTKIATVSSYGPEVKAHIVGKTVLRIIIEFKPDYYKIYRSKEYNDKEGSHSHILSVDDVNVTVDFPDSVGIIGATNRKIYTKSSIRLLAALKLNDNIFTYGVGPISFDWSLDNTLIAKLKFYKSPKDECTTNNSDIKNTCSTITNHIASYRNINPHNSLGVFLTTSSHGSIEVKLSVKINYAEPYIGKRPNTFVTYEEVDIQDEIYVDIPEFYENIPNKSGLYLIPLDIDHELHTNKNNNFVKYSLLSQAGAENKIFSEKEQILSLQDTGRITTYHKRGLAHILINQREKDNMSFIPVVLPVFVTDFHSLFVEKSYQLIDMEIGQVVKLKIIIQHEYGILFADGKFERIKLKVVESHPKVASVELIDSNSYISVRGLNKGETNIILFDPISLKIYDVFQVSVYSSLILPEKINLNLGGRVNFLEKDENRKLYLSQDSEWISDNPQILKIDPIEGKAVALGEGATKVHLVSLDRTKVKLTTKVEISRVKKVSIDRSIIPKYLTDIKDSPYYRSEYRIPVNVFLDESSDEELSLNINDNLNEIDQQLKLKCISNQPEIFLAETDQATLNSKTKECIIRIREIPFDVEPPSNLELKISVAAQGEGAQDTYSYKTTTLIPFMSSFKIKNKIKEITFSSNNRTNFIYINNMNDLEIDSEDPSLVKLEANREDEEGYVKIYVPYNVTSSFHDVRLFVTNKQTDQKEEILLNYVHAAEQPQRIFFGLIKRDSLIDFITLIILIIIIFILYNYLASSDQEKGRIVPSMGSAIKPPMGSNIRSTINMNK